MNCCLGCLLYGYSLSITNSVGWNLLITCLEGGSTNSEIETYRGILTAAVPLGAIIGALLAPFLMDRFALTKLFIYTDLLAIFFLSLSFLSLISEIKETVNSLILIVISRILFVIIVGINSALIPIYVKNFIT